jgi:hypothetical protein
MALQVDKRSVASRLNHERRAALSRCGNPSYILPVLESRVSGYLLTVWLATVTQCTPCRALSMYVAATAG